MPQSAPSLDTFLADFAEDVQRLLFFLKVLFGTDAVDRLLNLTDGNSVTTETPALQLGNFRLEGHAEVIYQYAMNARLLDHPGLPGLNDAMISILGLVALIDLTDGDHSASLETVYRKAIARSKLESVRDVAEPGAPATFSDWAEGNLTIEDVAWLCDMSPASVRNSTMANAKDPLTTFREDGKVFVEVKSLLDWLGRRRGYQEIQVIRLDVHENSQFMTLEELAAYLYACVYNRSVETSRLAEITGLSSADAFRFRMAGELSPDRWSLELIIGFARLLDIRDPEFFQRSASVLMAHKLRQEKFSVEAEIIPFAPRNRR